MYYTSLKLVRDGEQPEEKIEGPEDAINLIKDIFDASVEKFLVIALDTRSKVNAIQIVAVGGLNCAAIHPREVFQIPILTASASIIIAHNHPSGDPTPSSADIRLTQKFQAAADLLGIPISDHLILANGGKYHSMKKQNEL